MYIYITSYNRKEGAFLIYAWKYILPTIVVLSNHERIETETRRKKHQGDGNYTTVTNYLCIIHYVVYK